MPVTAQTRKVASKNTEVGTANTVERKEIKDSPALEGLPVDGGGDPAAAAAVAVEDDDAIAAFFQEVQVNDEAQTHVVRKVSFSGGQRLFRLGPDYVDEEYFECTPIPLYQLPVPVFDYDQFLEKSADDILVITPIRPRTFSALFAFYRDRGPALAWDPQLTDLEEDCFFQEVVNFPTSKLAYSLPRERKRDAVDKKRVKVFKPNGEFVIKTRLNIKLQESQTVVLLELASTLVLETDDNFSGTKAKNEKYLLMVKHHLESDSYANDYAQSFENYKLHKYSDYKIRGCLDVGTDCHYYFIEDEYRKVDADDVKRKIRETDELTARTLAEKARLDIPESGWKSSDSEDSSDEEADLTNFRVDVSRYKEDDDDEYNRQNILEDASEDEIPMSDDDEEFEINYPLKSVYERKKHQAKVKGPRTYPDISFSMIAFERVICMDSQQQKQADMRGFTKPAVVKIELPPEEEETEKAEELDEDAIVDLLIQQHRMQEHIDKVDAEGGDQDTIILPPEVTEAELQKIHAELGDDSIEDTVEGKEEKVEVPAKLESVKIIEPPAIEEPEEKDEFDLAYDGALPDGVDEGQESEGRKGLNRAETRDDDGFQDSGKDRLDDGSVLTDRYDKFSAMDGTGTQRTPMSVRGEEGAALTKIYCEWDESAERGLEAREEELIEKANAEVIDDEKLELPVATGEDEEPAAPWKDPHAEGKKEMIAEIGYQFSELIPPQMLEEGSDGEKVVEVEEKDDLSDESAVEEDSRLSDHKGLEDATSDSSDASEESVPSFKELVSRRSSAGKNFGLTKEEAITSVKKDDQASGPTLKNYWEFKSPQTSGKEVTDIALHPNNGNIIAVSYGSFQFGKCSEEGLVCIWNAKNNRNPERTYKLKSPATTLAFSEFSPYVLAVGMLDGNLALYDVRESDSVILGSTFLQEDKHIGPIWEIYWLVEEDSANDESISEAMLSLGDDGYLKKWSMTKGLESSLVMKVMRSTMQVPGRREKRSESLITTLSTAYTVCFFPDNADLFLLGTEEGFIHKCATAYKDQYVSTYVGHTGPVYRISFSAFDESVFVSCGGDWTIKIWKTDFPAPLLSMQTGHRTIFDVTCSLYSSTVFICCTEFHVEVWDLSLNTLEPVVQYKPPFGVALRKVAFNGLLNSAIIGNDEGGLSIFGLVGFPKPPTTKIYQTEALLEALMPGYKRRMKDGIIPTVVTTTEPSQAPIVKSAVSVKASAKVLDDDGRQTSLRNKL